MTTTLFQIVSAERNFFLQPGNKFLLSRFHGSSNFKFRGARRRAREKREVGAIALIGARRGEPRDRRDKAFVFNIFGYCALLDRKSERATYLNKPILYPAQSLISSSRAESSQLFFKIKYN